MGRLSRVWKSGQEDVCPAWGGGAGVPRDRFPPLMGWLEVAGGEHEGKEFKIAAYVWGFFSEEMHICLG